MIFALLESPWFNITPKWRDNHWEIDLGGYVGGPEKIVLTDNGKTRWHPGHNVDYTGISANGAASRLRLMRDLEQLFQNMTKECEYWTNT